MRLVVLIALALCSALPAAARNFITIDGKFTICKFGEFKDCDELTDAMLQSARFSADQKRVLRALKSFTGRDQPATVADLEKVFGKSAIFRPPGMDEVNATWLDDPKGKCPMCGIHAMFSKGDLMVIHYAVADKFMITWARAER